MAHALLALVAGLVFGAGLTVSQMVNPAKVLAFLDFGGIPYGAWDPSLALVMAGAIAVTLPGYRLVLRGKAPALGGTFALPKRRDVDARLVAGAALFGAGWGLGGYCPGPALTGLYFGAGKTAVFVLAMLAGMALYGAVMERR